MSMRRVQLILRAAALIILLLLGSCGKDKTVVFRNVNVIPMTSETVLTNQDVIIHGNTIRKIVPGGAADVSMADLVIPCDGKYLIPGLADMHIHLYLDTDGSELPLYIANGVTTIRDCNGRDFMLQWRKEVEKGRLAGPRLYLTTHTIRGYEDAPWTLVKERYEKGYDAVKFYSYFPSRTSFHKAMKEAKTLNAYTIGHIPYKLGLAGIIEEGMNEVAHVEELAWEFADIDTSLNMSANEWLPYIVGKYIQKYDGKSMAEVRALLKPEAREIARQLKGRHIPVTTTLYYSHILDQKLFNPDVYIRAPYFKYLPVKYYMNVGLGREKHQRQFGEIPHLVPVWQAVLEELMSALHEEHVTIVGGTDAIWDMGVVPGFSLHNELAYFVETGFTPYEALSFCTCNPGRVAARMDGLEKHHFGTVETGQLADLVLLEENPLEDINAVRNNCGVMANGRWFSPEDCAAMLYFDEQKHQDYLELYTACRELTRGNWQPVTDLMEKTAYEDIKEAVYTNVDICTKKIELLINEDRGDKAEKYFTETITHNWDDYKFLTVFSWRAGIDMKIAGVYPDAIRAVKRALELSKQAGIYETLALLYAYSGDYEQGITAAKEAKKLDPANKRWNETLQEIKEMRKSKHD